jgi:hypothetical protein
MLKLIKYELQARQFYLLLACSFAALYSSYRLFVLIRPLNLSVPEWSNMTFAMYGGFFMAELLLLYRDFFGDTRYLLFALPVKTTTTLGAKLIAFSLQFVFISAVILFFQGITNGILLKRFPESSGQLYWGQNFSGFDSAAATLLTLWLVGLFALTFSRAAVNRPRYSIFVAGRVFGAVLLLVFLYTVIVSESVVGFSLAQLLGLTANKGYLLYPFVKDFDVMFIGFLLLVWVGLYLMTARLLEKRVNI